MLVLSRYGGFRELLAIWKPDYSANSKFLVNLECRQLCLGAV